MSLYFITFEILSLIYQNVKRSSDPGVVYRAYSNAHHNQSANETEVIPSPIHQMWTIFEIPSSIRAQKKNYYYVITKDLTIRLNGKVTFAGDGDRELLPCRRRLTAAGNKGIFDTGTGFFSNAASSASTTEVPLDALFSPESRGVLGKLDIMLESG